MSSTSNGTPVKAWSEVEVSAWLNKNGFSDLIAVFRENDINGELLAQLDHELLKELGVSSVGKRMRLLKEVQTLTGEIRPFRSKAEDVPLADELSREESSSVPPQSFKREDVGGLDSLAKALASLDDEMQSIRARSQTGVKPSKSMPSFSTFPSDAPVAAARRKPAPAPPAVPSSQPAITSSQPITSQPAITSPVEMTSPPASTLPSKTPDYDDESHRMSPLNSPSANDANPDKPPRPSRSLYAVKALVAADQAAANKSSTLPAKPNGSFSRPNMNVPPIVAQKPQSIEKSPSQEMEPTLAPKTVRLISGKVLPPPPSAPVVRSPSNPTLFAQSMPSSPPPLSPEFPLDQSSAPSLFRGRFDSSSSTSIASNIPSGADDEASDDSDDYTTDVTPSTTSPLSSPQLPTKFANNSVTNLASNEKITTSSAGVIVSEDNRPVIATAVRDHRPTPERPDLDFKKDDLFVVIDMKNDSKEWRVKPFGKRGNVMSVPKELLQIDGTVFVRIQQQYGQKVFSDDPKSQAKSGTSKKSKSVIAVPAKALLQPVMQGYLFKIGATALSKSVWRKRFCVLKDYVLYYYRTPEDMVAQGKVPLPGYVVSPAPDDVPLASKKFMFKVTHPNSRTYVFASETKEEMDRWMYAINLSTVLEDLPDDR